MLMNILLNEPDWLMILYDNFNQSRTEIPRDAYRERERKRTEIMVDAFSRACLRWCSTNDPDI